MSRKRKAAAAEATVSRTEAAIAARLGHAVHVRTSENEGRWMAKAVDPRTPGTLPIAGAAGYRTEREALEALAGLCTCDARRGHALACAKVWGA